MHGSADSMWCHVSGNVTTFPQCASDASCAFFLIGWFGVTTSMIHIGGQRLRRPLWCTCEIRPSNANMSRNNLIFGGLFWVMFFIRGAGGRIKDSDGNHL